MARWDLDDIFDIQKLPFTVDFLIWDTIYWMWEYPDASNIRSLAGAIESQGMDSSFYPFCFCHKGILLVIYPKTRIRIDNI